MTELRLLEILSAFEKAGTQAAAAEKLHISQPTLSSAMKRLEEEIGAPLFERSKNRMALNENGMAAAEYARRILREEQEMRSHIQEMERKKHTGSMAACTVSAVNRLTLPLSMAFPDKQITTSLCPDFESLQDMLYQETVTFIVVDHPLIDERVYCVSCYTEHLLVVVPEDLPQARAEFLSFADLKDEQLLIHGNGGAWDQLLHRKLDEKCLLPQSSFQDFANLVSSLPVWAFSSDTFANAQVAPRHVVVPVSDEDAHLDYWLCCLKQKKKEADRLLSFMK